MTIIEGILSVWEPLVAGVIGLSLPIAYKKIKRAKERPAKLERSVAEMSAKLDAMIETYVDGERKNLASQRTLFTVQDRQFKVMRSQTGAIRELSKSVCNGNKDAALVLCDQADAMCADGEDIQKDYLIQR